MTDHIRDSIDQLFPPEPPDDPRPEPPPPPDDALREALADYAHEAWSGWMNYLLSKSIVNGDGTWTIPASLVTRWYRQMSTPYHLLPEDEQASDRDEAEKMLAIMADGRAAALLRAVEMLEQHAEIDNAHPFFGTLRTDYHLLPQQGSHAWVAVGRNQMSTTCDTIADALIELARKIDAV